MLKKTGIVVAAAAALTVAAAPLAFAGDSKSHYPWRSDHSSSVDYTTVDNSVDRDQHNRCSFNQESSSADSLLGVVPLLDGQTQALNCTNVGDITVLDLDGTNNDVVVPPTTTP